MTMDAGSKKRLEQAHPLLQKLFNEVAKTTNIQILQSQRGEKAQNDAYAQGRTKPGKKVTNAKFGESAHNWSPAIALDVTPLPLNWGDWMSFEKLAKGTVLPLAEKLGIPIRWGGDWDKDGKHEPKEGDGPHYELHPWREWAKKSKPFKG